MTRPLPKEVLKKMLLRVLWEHNRPSGSYASHSHGIVAILGDKEQKATDTGQAQLLLTDQLPPKKIEITPLIRLQNMFKEELPIAA